MNNEIERLSLRDTARGVAIRAGLLSMVAIVLSAWLFGLVARAAGAVVKIFAGALLLAIGGGIATWQVKKVQRRFSERSQPGLNA
jgi:hypothetical protein